MILCVEGCNATGKTHTLNAFAELLTARGITFRMYKAPDYAGLHGARITEFLAGNTLSGNHMYEAKQHALTASEREHAANDYRAVDVLFRENRDYVYNRIQRDQAADPVQVILLDRWLQSAVTYSALRFQDIGAPVHNDYFAHLVAGERVPDITLIIEEPGEVIVQRMANRISLANGPVPKVWRQTADCYERIMNAFRLLQNPAHSNYCYFVTSASIHDRLHHIANTLSASTAPDRHTTAWTLRDCAHPPQDALPAE